MGKNEALPLPATYRSDTTNDDSLSSWRYEDASARDLRIDFIRGLIMMIVITVHMEYFSLYSFVVWERVGAISSAEGFVALSGMVLGMVYSRKANKQGYSASTTAMVDRSLKLYRVSLGVIVLIALLNLLPFIDAKEVMQWRNPGTGEIFPLYPGAGADMKQWVGRLLLLKIGPHQFQVMGLYVCLLAIAPLLLWLCMNGRTKEVLGFSAILYAVNWAFGYRPTGAQFEYAFPLLTWQFLFVIAFVIGIYKADAFKVLLSKSAISVAAIAAVGFWLFTMNNPNPTLPEWAKFTFISESTFWEYYGGYFQKSGLGLGRLVNNLALFTVVLALLTRFWVPINKSLGWLFVPIGQASLYVFIVHVFFVLAASLLPLRELNNFWINTAVHTATIAAVWIMVRQKVLFNLIPR